MSTSSPLSPSHRAFSPESGSDGKWAALWWHNWKATENTEHFPSHCACAFSPEWSSDHKWTNTQHQAYTCISSRGCFIDNNAYVAHAWRSIYCCWNEQLIWSFVQFLMHEEMKFTWWKNHFAIFLFERYLINTVSGVEQLSSPIGTENKFSIRNIMEFCERN